MVEIEDIVDRESLLEWLKEKPREVAVNLVHRSAMRRLPFYWNWELVTDHVLNLNRMALPVLRENLITGCLLNCSDSESALSLKIAVEKAYRSGDSEPVKNAKDAYSAYTAADDAAYMAANLDNTWYIDAATDDLEILRIECHIIETGQSLSPIPLWGENMYVHAGEWPEIKRLLSLSSENWSFWIKWYEAALNGEPLDYKMLEQIALIPSDDWEKGSAHVNAIIAKIETEFELKAKIAELEGKLLQISSSGRGIGDNQGPPMADEPVAKEIMIIWEPLQELKQEIEEKSPSRERLLEIAKKIGSLASAILKWTGGMANFAMKTYIGLAVAKLSTQADPIAIILTTISDLVIKFAGYLP